MLSYIRPDKKNTKAAVSQDALITNLNLYLNFINYPLVLNLKGVCAGLTSLYLFYKARRQENVFQEMLEKIATLKEKDYEKQKEWLNTFIMRVAHAQESFEYENSHQGQMEKYFKSSNNEFELKKNISTSFHLDSKYFEKFLESFIQDEEMVYLGAEGHAIAVFKRDNTYYFYDPNGKDGELAFKNLKELKQALIQAWQIPHDKKAFTISVNNYSYIDKIRNRRNNRLSRRRVFPSSSNILEMCATDDLMQTIMMAAHYNDEELIKTTLATHREALKQTSDISAWTTAIVHASSNNNYNLAMQLYSYAPDMSENEKEGLFYTLYAYACENVNDELKKKIKYDAKYNNIIIDDVNFQMATARGLIKFSKSENLKVLLSSRKNFFELNDLMELFDYALEKNKPECINAIYQTICLIKPKPLGLPYIFEKIINTNDAALVSKSLSINVPISFSHILSSLKLPNRKILDILLGNPQHYIKHEQIKIEQIKNLFNNKSGCDLSVFNHVEKMNILFAGCKLISNPEQFLTMKKTMLDNITSPTASSYYQKAGFDQLLCAIAQNDTTTFARLLDLGIRAGDQKILHNPMSDTNPYSHAIKLDKTIYDMVAYDPKFLLLLIEKDKSCILIDPLHLGKLTIASLQIGNIDVMKAAIEKFGEQVLFPNGILSEILRYQLPQETVYSCLKMLKVKGLYNPQDLDATSLYRLKKIVEPEYKKEINLKTKVEDELRNPKAAELPLTKPSIAKDAKSHFRKLKKTFASKDKSTMGFPSIITLPEHKSSSKNDLIQLMYYDSSTEYSVYYKSLNAKLQNWMLLNERNPRDKHKSYHDFYHETKLFIGKLISANNVNHEVKDLCRQMQKTLTSKVSSDILQNCCSQLLHCLKKQEINCIVRQDLQKAVAIGYKISLDSHFNQKILRYLESKDLFTPRQISSFKGMMGSTAIKNALDIINTRQEINDIDFSSDNSQKKSSKLSNLLDNCLELQIISSEQDTLITMLPKYEDKISKLRELFFVNYNPSNHIHIKSIS